MLGERFNEHQHRFQTLGYFGLVKKLYSQCTTKELPQTVGTGVNTEFKKRSI